eukprot:12837890-Prorocentrum_lima.AAC.1
MHSQSAAVPPMTSASWPGVFIASSATLSTFSSRSYSTSKNKLGSISPLTRYLVMMSLRFQKTT